MSKFARVSELVAVGDFKGAVLAASKSSKLGVYRNPILDAKLAYTNPGFLRQLKKCPDEAITAGEFAVIALCAS